MVRVHESARRLTSFPRDICDCCLSLGGNRNGPNDLVGGPSWLPPLYLPPELRKVEHWRGAPETPLAILWVRRLLRLTEFVAIFVRRESETARDNSQ
jgi:hypothetical protein